MRRRGLGGLLAYARAIGASLVLAGAVLVTGCGSSSSSPGVRAPTIAPARTFKLAGFEPSTPVRAGVPTRVAFDIQQPSGKPLTAYKTGSGPHTGVHLILVREDLSALIHRHPAVGPDGRISQPVVFPAPGRWRVLVDAYPHLPNTLPNFQLFDTIDVAGEYRPHRCPRFARRRSSTAFASPCTAARG